jgi:hypothetical protein
MRRKDAPSLNQHPSLLGPLAGILYLLNGRKALRLSLIALPVGIAMWPCHNLRRGVRCSTGGGSTPSIR